MTLLQLTALHALAPVSLTELAQALGTRPPATSAMVDRLTHSGLVCRTPDPHHRRRIHLTSLRMLFRRLSTGEVVEPTWPRFSFPIWWHYDVLRALDYFRTAGNNADPRAG